MNNTLRTIIRFAIILVFLILLVLLSIALFKLIPKGINQLAESTLSITNNATTSNSSTTLIHKVSENTSTATTSGLSIISSVPVETKTNTITKTVYVNRPIYYPATTPTRTGLKNIKVTKTDYYTSGDMIIVRYKILNEQDTATGAFSMRVEMPALNYNDRVRYINDINLGGQSAYEVEARFSGLNTSVNPVVNIYADINNQVNETDENDNFLSVRINTVNYNYNNNYNNNCSYYNNCNNNNCNYYNNCYDNNYLSPNLTISSIETGKMINNSFNPQANFAYGDNVALRVRVRNTGDSFRNNWSTRTYFYDMNGVYRSVVTDNELPLNSNGEVTLIIQTNNQINRGNTLFNFSLDTNNNVYESNENDNTANVSAWVY